MSSANPDLLAKILQAKYELENCGERSKGRVLGNLNTLLDQAITQSEQNISRHELLEALRDKMSEYRRCRRRQEQPWRSV